MESQDFKVVVLNTHKKDAPKRKQEGEIVSKNGTGTLAGAGANRQQQPPCLARKVEEKVEGDDSLTIPKVSRSLQLQIQSARQAKKWTQRQLAQACNLKDSVVRDYEAGSAIPDGRIMQRMGKALGVSLRK
jgi:ribosome-binding protein aMBF1 (putative translation factor)